MKLACVQLLWILPVFKVDPISLPHYQFLIDYYHNQITWYLKIVPIYLLAYRSGSQKSRLGFNMTKISSCGAVLVLEGCGEKQNLFSPPLVTFKGCLGFLG